MRLRCGADREFRRSAADLAVMCPEQTACVTGVDPELVRQAARMYAQAQRGMVPWGMGIIPAPKGRRTGALAMANWIYGGCRTGRRWMPLRGQATSRSQRYAGAFQRPARLSLDHRSGCACQVRGGMGRQAAENEYLTLIETEAAAASADIRAMYIMGDNAVAASSDTHTVEAGMRNLEFLVVQDLFLSETARFADVVLPAAAFLEKDGTFTNTERRVQVLRKAVAAPGEARPDWQIVCDIATAMGYPMAYPDAAAIMKEIASLVPSYAGISHERLTDGGLQWPCPDRSHPGTRFLLGSIPNRERARLVHRTRSAARHRAGKRRFPADCRYRPPA